MLERRVNRLYDSWIFSSVVLARWTPAHWIRISLPDLAGYKKLGARYVEEETVAYAVSRSASRPKAPPRPNRPRSDL